MNLESRRLPPRILCAGITVLDEVFQVEKFPQPDGKTSARQFFIVSGGCAANAAIAISRLGARVTLASPIGGPAGEDANGDRVLAALALEHVDCSGCQRISGASTAISAIFIDARGDRMIVTYRDARLAGIVPADPVGLVTSVDAVLADNRYPAFVQPLCKAAREQGKIVVLDADKPTHEGDDLFKFATHVVFSSECLRATTGIDDLGKALGRFIGVTDAFLAVTNGSEDVLWFNGDTLCRSPAFKIKALDTLGAGDAFHGAFTLALVEGRDIAEAVRFGSAVAAIKCTRFGGSSGAPSRAEVDTFLASAV